MVQTMSHIVNECPLTIRSDSGMQRLHPADECNKPIGPKDESTCKSKIDKLLQQVVAYAWLK